MIKLLAPPSSESFMSKDGDALISFRPTHGSTAVHFQFRLDVRWILV